MKEKKTKPLSIAVGGRIVESHEEVVDGQKVHVIDSFELMEASFVSKNQHLLKPYWQRSKERAWFYRNWPYLILAVLAALAALAAMYFVLRIT